LFGANNAEHKEADELCQEAPTDISNPSREGGKPHCMRQNGQTP
jgi:hypothetical protein